MLLNDRTGGGHSPTPLVAHNNDKGYAKMLCPIFDRPHRRGINHVARITGDKKLTYAKAAK
jgi:hypothetical protein